MSEEAGFSGEDVMKKGFRRGHLDDFLKRFADAGYTILESDKERIASAAACWEEDNTLVTGAIRMHFVQDSGKEVLRLIPAADMGLEEYTKITEQLQKGQEAHAELQKVKGENAELEQRLHEAKDQLHGTKTGIEGLQSQKETEAAALEVLRKELEDMRSEKENIVKFIAEKDPTIKAVETEIGVLASKLLDAQKICEEQEAALQRTKDFVKEERAEMAAKEKRLKETRARRKAALAELKEATEAKKAELDLLSAFTTLREKLDALAAEVLEKEPEQEATPKATDSAIGRLWDGAKASAKTIFRKKPEEPKPIIPDDVKQYFGVLDKMRAAFAAIAESGDVTQSPEYKQLQALYQDRAFAVQRLLSKLIELPEIDPQAKLDRGVLVKFYQEAEKLKKSAAAAGISKEAETLLDDLLGAVDADPTDEEVANPEYVRAFVEGVRKCGFELYSLVSSSNPEGMVYVLADLADSKYEAGDTAAAVELTKRGIALCKEQLPEDKETLADFEANLKLYSDNSE